MWSLPPHYSFICTPVCVSFCFLPKIVKSRDGHTWTAVTPAPDASATADVSPFILLVVVSNCEVVGVSRCCGRSSPAGPPLCTGHSHHIFFVERSGSPPVLRVKSHLFSVGPHPCLSLQPPLLHLLPHSHCVLPAPGTLQLLTCIERTPASGPLHVLFPGSKRYCICPFVCPPRS